MSRIRRCLGLLAAGALTASLVSPQASAANPLNGSISGSVTSSVQAGWSPDATIVTAWQDSADGWVKAGATNPVDGNYTIDDLAAGQYRVEFEPTKYRVPEWWDDAPDLESATDIEVGPGATVTGIDADISPMGRITGTVTNRQGEPLADLSVYALAAAEPSPLRAGVTDAQGRYSILGLPAGSYRLEIRSDFHFEGTFLAGADSFADAADVVIDGTEEVSGVDVVMPRAAEIRGTVSTIYGPATDARLDWWRQRSDGVWRMVAFSLTDETGAYRARRLAPGSYYLDISGEAWGPGAPEENRERSFISEVFELTDGMMIEAPDLPLAEPGSVSGTMPPSATTDEIRGRVELLLERGGQFVPSGWGANVDAAGVYRIPGVPPGSYIVEFEDEAPETAGVSYWPASEEPEGAQPIRVESGAETGGISSATAGRGSIRGTLSLPFDGTHLSWATPFREQPDGTWKALDRLTVRVGEVGGYHVRGLRPGSYKIRFTEYRDRFALEYAGGAHGLEDADEFTVAAGEHLVGPHVDLQQAWCILGCILDGNGRAIARGGTLTPYLRVDDRWQRLDARKAGSDYELSDLPAGRYRLEFRDPDNLYAGEFHGGSRDLTGAGDIVLADDNSAGHDFTLELLTRAIVEPRVMDEPQVGRRVEAFGGFWSPLDRALRYQWAVDGEPIPGATSRSYVPEARDRGKRLTVEVTASRPGYLATRAVSPPSAVVRPSTQPRISSSRKPRLLGKLRVGSSVRVKGARWSPEPQDVRYRWFADGKRLRGETARRLELRPRHEGNRLRVRLVASRPGHRSARVDVIASRPVGGR